MTKKERQAYKRGIADTLLTIVVFGAYILIAIGFMMR